MQDGVIDDVSFFCRLGQSSKTFLISLLSAYLTAGFTYEIDEYINKVYLTQLPFVTV